MEDKTILMLAAIIAIVIIEVVALFNNIDGQLMALCMMIIGGIAGYSAPELYEKIKG